MLQGKHCEFHNSNQVTILPSFKHMSQEKKWEMMGVLFYRLCILDQVCGEFFCLLVEGSEWWLAGIL